MSQTTLFMRDYWGQASGKQQWPQYRHRYTSLVYKPSADNANLERNAHIYRRTHWNPHVISLAGIYGLLDLQTHFTTLFWLFFPLIWCPQPNFESPMYVLPSHGKFSEGLMWRLGLQQVLKNINSVFIVQRDGCVKEARALSQPSSSVIRLRDTAPERRTLHGWHNPKRD